MELMLKNEACIFFGTVLGGFVLGIICDVLGQTSGEKDGNIIFVGIKDIIFCIVMSLVCFIIIYTLNNGQIRWYEIFGIIAGFVLYSLTIKKFVLASINILKNVVKKLFVFVFIPVKALGQLFKVPCIKLKNALKKVKNIIKTVKYKQKFKIKQIKYIFKKI